MEVCHSRENFIVCWIYLICFVLMAEVQVRKGVLAVEEGEIPSDKDISSRFSDTNTERSEKSAEDPKSGKRKRTSRYDQMEEKWSSKFNGLSSEMSGIKQSLNVISSLLQNKEKGSSECSPKRHRLDKSVSPKRQKRSHSRRHRRSERFSMHTFSDSSPSDEDQLSLYDRSTGFSSDEGNKTHLSSRSPSRSPLHSPSQSSVRNLETESLSKNVSVQDSQSKNDLDLFKVFGDDAKFKKDVVKMGISIDNSQKETLNNSWHCDQPSFLTATGDNYEELFPVDAETEKILQVPSLDDMVEDLLVENYGSKAAFTSKKTSLFNQPCKMVEHILYKGQQAAKYALTMQLYTQQCLGKLMVAFQDDSLDKEKCTTQIRDIFAISTKCLEQIGRTGAFHHIGRRQLAMADTKLFKLRDRDTISNLPLRSDGVFGSQLNSNLENRKDKRKAIKELFPELGLNRKRKAVTEESYQNLKRSKPSATVSSMTTARTPSNFSGDFRIPRIQKGEKSQYQRGRRFSTRGKPDFTRRSSVKERLGDTVKK